MVDSTTKSTSRSDRKKATDGRISLPQAARIAALPPATLTLWVTSGLVEPSDAVGVSPGRGNHRRFDLRDLTAIVTLAELRAEGVNVRKLRQVQTTLREYGRSFSSARLALVSRGEGVPVDVVMVDSAKAESALATSLVANPGQYLIAAIDLEPVAARAQRAFAKALREAPAIRGRRPNKILRAGQSGSRRQAG